MLFKFVIMASLAVVGVFGRTSFGTHPRDYDPYDQYSQIVATEYCKVTQGENKVPEVKESLKTFAKCITSLFDSETISRDIKAASDGGTYDTIIRKYCVKAPQVKHCASDLVKGMTPCLPPGLTSHSVNSTNALIDFLCDNDAARVTTFLKEGGVQCVQEKQLNVGICQQTMQSNITQLTHAYGGGIAGALALSEKEICSVSDQGLACYVNVLRGCSSPTLVTLGQEFHDIYLESMSCFEVTEVPKVTVANEIHDNVEQLKKKKLELEIRIAELEMWNRENELNVQHTDLTSDIKKN